MQNMKKVASHEDRMRQDEENFKRAGMGPIVKTYKLNSKEAQENLRAAKKRRQR